IKFRPSAAALNPLTKDVWIVSSTNQLIVVIDRKGDVKDIYTLNPVIFNQPEGITFTPWGDLLIANEAGDKYSSATLLIFKHKK
ncbi:MAG: SdiA-regulated family protein, partial [Ginsengibacter sp.]